MNRQDVKDTKKRIRQIKRTRSLSLLPFLASWRFIPVKFATRSNPVGAPASCRTDYAFSTKVNAACLPLAASCMSSINVGSEDTIGGITCLIREVELRREDRAVRDLYLDMDVPRPSGVQAGNNGFERKAPRVVGVLVAAQSVAGVVVDTRVVRLPEVEQGARGGCAIGGEDGPRHDEACARYSRLHKRHALRRTGLEVRPFGLCRRDAVVVSVAAGRGRGQHARFGNERCTLVAIIVGPGSTEDRQHGRQRRERPRQERATRER